MILLNKLMILLKSTKNQGFTLSLEDTFFEKRQRGQIDPPSRFRVPLGKLLVFLKNFQ